MNSASVVQNLIIRNAEIVTAKERFTGDIRISREKIVELAKNVKISDENYREINAEGMLALPGGIDPHVHLTLPPSVPTGERWVDDFTSGSRAALAGGITTVGNISFPEMGESPLATLTREAQIASEEAIVDVMLHPVIMRPSEEALKQIPQLARLGNTSIKVFMVTREFENHFAGYLEILKTAGREGIITMLHCEDYTMIESTTDNLVSEGKSALYYYAESRSVESEVIATRRAIEMCETTGAPIYIVHLSSQPALEVCEQAFSHSLPVYVETRPLYLHFTKEKFHDPDGGLFVGQPPLRTAEDITYLWQGLVNGAIHTIGTDHAPWTREQKLHPSHDITNLRPGVNNLQVMLPLLFSEGVVKGKISMERFVALTSSNSAKLFGLYPQKGTIAVGSDADIVLWNPGLTRIIRGDDMFSRAGFSVYEGIQVTGWPVMTIRRGEVVYENGKITAEPGSGKIPKRSVSQKPS